VAKLETEALRRRLAELEREQEKAKPLPEIRIGSPG
jgi:hypothetical protein